MVADTPPSRSEIISPLRKKALDTLQQNSIEALAQGPTRPMRSCVGVEVQRDAAMIGFTLTVSLWFFNPDK